MLHKHVLLQHFIETREFQMMIKPQAGHSSKNTQQTHHHHILVQTTFIHTPRNMIMTGSAASYSHTLKAGLKETPDSA
jgi:hypothetical protein